MKAAQVVEKGRIECIEAPVPEPGPGEVLVRTACASLCGSDLHYVYLPLEPQAFPARYGYPGHEGVGEIVESALPSLPAGTQVLTAPNPHVSAGFAEYQAIGARHVVPLPGNADPGRLVVAQPLGTVIYGVRHFMPPEPPETAVVLGQGAIGMFFSWLLKQAGVGRVIASDIEPGRLALAREYGADVALDARSDNVVSAVADLTGGRGAPLVVEAAGTDLTRREAVAVAAESGTVGLFGLAEGLTMDRFPYAAVFAKRLTLKTTHGTQFEFGHASFATAINLIASGQLDVGPLLTHRFDIERIGEAFRTARERSDGAVKLRIAFE